ncbi:MAG: FAD-dependent oxidoreductase [Hyphomicrobiaceae bacterium]
MSAVLAAQGISFDERVPVAVIGAGAGGLVAALKAKAAGADVIVLERDSNPSGSTAMSSGFIPAPRTRCQLSSGLPETDSPKQFANDIQVKSKRSADARLVKLATETIGPTLDWLEEDHGLSWELLDGFLYPGHTRHRMHSLPERTGAALVARLLTAVDTAEVPIITSARTDEIYANGMVVHGIGVLRPDGTRERIGCSALILACNGYGGNSALVTRHIPDMANAPYFGHAGNQGDAILWGEAMGAATQHLSGYQGHGSLAHPHGILITWALMMEGGVQVNESGNRFSNEHRGYSEQAAVILSQPNSVAWSVFDDRLLEFARDFPDFQAALDAGAVRTGRTVAELADAISVPTATLAATLADIEACQAGRATDAFGRDFTNNPPLSPPYHAVRVTGALFHTQGGLLIDNEAHVLHREGHRFPNLFAAGGAACGVTGPGGDGYLSGNGLLTAIAFGAIAGESAARLCQA